MNKQKCKYCGYGGELQDKDYPDWVILDGENSVCGECAEQAAIDPDMIGKETCNPKHPKQQSPTEDENLVHTCCADGGNCKDK